MERGFTLIELVMIILLIAIMAAVVIPRLDIYSGMQLKTAAKKVASDIRYAQSVAMTNRTTDWVRITFRANSSLYRIYSKTGNIKNPFTQATSFLTRLNQGEYQGITVQSNFETIFKYPFGNSSSALPRYLRLAKGTAFQNISVTPVTGKVTIK